MDHFNPTRPDFSPYGFTCVRWRASRMPRFDRHNEIELNLLERGSLVYLIAGRKVTVSAGRLTVFWAGVPHQVLHFKGVSDYFVLTVPLVWFLQWGLPDRLAHSILHGTTVVEPDAGHLSADRARFESWLEDVRSGSEERRRACLLEVEARLRRLSEVGAPDLPHPPRRKPSVALEPTQLSRAEQMASFISLNYTEPLTAEAIGRHVGLHPNYAMALFQRTFGTTLIKYVTQHRLSHAQRLLVTTADQIVNIALDSGFGSLSRFNEAFRQSFGCTPRQYRSVHRS